MILYFTDAGRIKQRVLCCRKFIIIFGSSDLRVIEQLLALAAECPGKGGGGEHLGIFWVGMCRPGLQIGTLFEKHFPYN